MSYRLEEDGVTLHLFCTEGEAKKLPGAVKTTAYAFGWIAQTSNNAWFDACGGLPREWTPSKLNLEEGARRAADSKAEQQSA